MYGLSLLACKPSATAPAANERAAEGPAHESSSPRAAQGGGDVSATFEGRELAQTMSYLGASWLTRAERDAEENTTLLHAQLGLASGDVACDVGAGNGYHSLLMAAAVGPEGKVIASDLQPEMLALLDERAAQAEVANIDTVRAQLGDPNLPAGRCDLILLVDVYHEFALPEQALASMRAALSEGGRIALVEYRAEDPEVPIKPLHKMSKAQILAEYLPRGYALVGEFDELPWQHLMFFGRSSE